MWSLSFLGTRWLQAWLWEMGPPAPAVWSPSVASSLAFACPQCPLPRVRHMSLSCPCASEPRSHHAFCRTGHTQVTLTGVSSPAPTPPWTGAQRLACLDPGPGPQSPVQESSSAGSCSGGHLHSHRASVPEPRWNTLAFSQSVPGCVKERPPGSALSSPLACPNVKSSHPLDPQNPCW